MTSLKIVTISGVDFLRGQNTNGWLDTLIRVDGISYITKADGATVFVKLGPDVVRLAGNIEDLISERSSLNQSLPPIEVNESQGDLLTGKQVQARYSKSHVTLWRWVRDPKMNFPQPMVINGLNHWRLADLRSWEASQS